MPQDSNDLFFLGITYIIALGLGVMVSKLGKWLRFIIVFIVVGSFLAKIDFQTVNMPIFFVILVPLGLFAYPSLAKTLSPSSGLNPFVWIIELIQRKQYRKNREKEQEHEKESLEVYERIVRMQTEEAERQRQYEREKAEREAREQARQQTYQENHNSRHKRDERQNNQSNEQRREKPKPDEPRNEDPYEVLGVTRSMSKAEIRKVYLKLMSQYAPDHVSHLSEEFQKMAHEKCIAFNLAWEKIQKEK